jgi:predicted DNA-binding transcriptional regulator YafY
MAERTIKRANLLNELERLYSDRAYSDAELAERFDVDRSTIYKARKTMELEVGLPFIEEGRGRYRLDPQHRLSNVRLSPAEALALYIGGRRLQQQTRTHQRHVASALEKLARALRRPMMEQLTRAAQVVLDQQPSDDAQSEVMERIIEGWATGRKIRIQHHRLGGKVRTYTVCPYQLEPSVWGDGVYLIGHSDYHNGIATFKVARIVHASVTVDPFCLPDDFDSHDLLQHAWGIWADGEPAQIVLRFSAAAAPRVKESIWHPSQVIIDEADGGCLWRAHISGTREMMPWVLSWGPEVEVLEPAAMRDEVATRLRAAAGVYGG